MSRHKKAAENTAEWLVGCSRGFFIGLTGSTVKLLRPHTQHTLVRNSANIISVARLVASIWVAPCLYRATTILGTWFWVGVIVVVMASDGIDGTLARRLKIVSLFGALVDPFADKVLIGSLIIGLAFKFESPVFTGLAVVLLLVELGNIIAGFIGGRKARKLAHPEKAGAGTWGKLKFGGECSVVLIGWALLPYSQVINILCSVLLAGTIILAVKSLQGYVRKIRIANRVLAGEIVL